MTTVYWRHPANTEVKQVWSGTITNTNGATYSVSAADDDGTSATITYTCANPPATTVTLAATAFITLWNASSNPIISRFVATQNAGQVILTAKTAGVPVTFSTGGTGTWSSTGNTTDNVGNTDFDTARNWSSDSVPVTSNSLQFSSGTVGVLYGLDQSSKTFAAVSVEAGCSSLFGQFINGSPHYFRCGASSFDYRGSSSLAMFDIGSSSIPVYIESAGTPGGNRKYAVYLKGSGITTATVNRGKVAIAGLAGETSAVQAVNIGYVGNQRSDSDVRIGSGVTLTTLNQSGGYCSLGCGAATVTVADGATLTTDGTGAITTMNVYGTAYLNSTGTVTTINVYGGVLDLTRSRDARTVTTVNLYDGAELRTGSWITHTNKPAPAGAGSVKIVYVG